jgi:hypothetical protein
MVLSLSVGLIGPRKFGGITNFCTIDRGQAVKVRTHLHFRIEVLFFGTIFKNSIFIVKNYLVSASCWCCGRAYINIGTWFES